MREFSLGKLVDILATLRLRMEDLSHDLRFAYVLPFKNHGQAAGASLRHSHSQIIATPVVPGRVLEELQVAQAHWNQKRRSIFVDIMDQELMMRERLVFESEQMLAFCPFASSNPFEVHIYPRRAVASFRGVSMEELRGLARAIKTVLLKWQAALGDVAYNLLIRSVPNNTLLSGIARDFPLLDAYYVWHVEMFPRLSRAAGFEWGTGFYINPTPPEEAAQYLRTLEVELQ
jgi:UDPglucose--hexose-1-phosphate uridylyltransferase